ncbi:MAG TPA: hypothetical protein VMW52_13430, partial [Phycisphaerae bacterium]|nr:hypothetical protein [Phycisphaerae bacterium]
HFLAVKRNADILWRPRTVGLEVGAEGVGFIRMLLVQLVCGIQGTRQYEVANRIRGLVVVRGLLQGTIRPTVLREDAGFIQELGHRGEVVGPKPMAGERVGADFEIWHDRAFRAEHAKQVTREMGQHLFVPLRKQSDEPGLQQRFRAGNEGPV